MKETKLIPVKNNLFFYIKEWIYSKIDKNYILKSNSPQKLLKNEKLIVRTLERNPAFLESLPDEIIFKNDIFIKIAIEKGYTIRKNSRFIDRIDFLSKYIDISGEIPVLVWLDYSVFENQQFREKFLYKAKKQQYLISGKNVPQFLLEDKDLLLIYYENLLANNEQSDDLTEILRNRSVLTSNSIIDISFLSDFIKLCNEKNIDKQKLLSIILDTPNANKVLKNNLQVVNLIFNELQPENLRDFFERLQISNEGLKIFFENNFIGNLEELKKIYKINPLVIDTLNGKLLGKGIPIFKLQEYAGDEEFQKKLLSLSPYKYELFKKISSTNLSKTDRWNRLDSRTLDNLLDGYYEELLNDIFLETQKGNKITKEELDILANLFSAYIMQGTREARDMYGGELQNNNVFNITTKKELEYYEKIKEAVCSIVITNPQLKDNEEIKRFDKYLQYFKILKPIDRIKLAIMQRNFGMNLQDAYMIMKNFGSNINDLTSTDENDKNVIEQIKAICNILNCEDIEVLQEIGQLTYFVNLDLDQATLLFDDAKKIFEKDLKKDLYSPQEEDFITFYEGIKIYKAPLEFEAITKFSSGTPDKRVWLRSYSVFNDKKNFRRSLSMSFTNGELLNPTNGGLITFGFGKEIKDFQFAGMFIADAHSNMSANPVYCVQDEENCTYKGKEEFISETVNNYNEVIVDTLVIDDTSDSNKKLMPEYMIYYQRTSNMTEEERNNDVSWQNSIKAAKEFGIPVVILDCEAIRKNELRKIQEGILQNSSDYKSIKRLVRRIRHYIYRYQDEHTKDVPEISELITEEELKEKEKFVEENEPQSSFDFSKYTQDEIIKQKIKENTRILEGAEIFER